MLVNFSTEHLQELRKIFGPNELFTDAEVLATCSKDHTEDLCYLPAVVVKPSESKQIVELLKFATREKIAVTPRAGGTGLSGAALPVCGGILLSLEKLNRILEIDEKNHIAVVEPGVITEAFQNEVQQKGLYYPPDPASRGSCFLGGNIAHCSGGPHALKYGVTKDYVCGIEAVLPSGEMIRHGGKLLKNSTGYNLTQLLIGSEGTLAVVTKIFLKLIPYPSHRVLILAPFETLEAPARAVSAFFHAGLTPSACEYIERSAYEAGCKHTGQSNPFPSAAATLLIELDGFSQIEIERQMETLAAVLEQHGAGDALLADSSEKQNELWALRRSIGEAVKSRSVYKEEDTVVPRFELPALLTQVKTICARHGVTSVCYGHAGDGNLHVNLLKEQLSEEKWQQELPACVEEIFKGVIELGGTLSGEHGIGFSQKRYLHLAYSQTEINLMKHLKASFDPLGLLNPLKIFPDVP